MVASESGRKWLEEGGFEAWKKRVYPPDGTVPEPTPPKEKRQYGVGKTTYANLVKDARASGQWPLNDEKLEYVRSKIAQLEPGVECTLVHLTENTHRTVTGDFVAVDVDTAIVNVKGRFNKVPLRMVVYGLYKRDQQSTPIT